MEMRRGRNEWSLDGEWLFTWDENFSGSESYRSEADLKAAGYTLYPAHVPGNFELDLHRNGLIPDPFFGMNPADLTRYEYAHIWYCRKFDAAEGEGQEAVLRLEGVDCFAQIFLNGKLLGASGNMLVEHEFRLPPLLQEGNELCIHLLPSATGATFQPYSPSLHAQANNFDSLFVRKAPHVYGWDIMPRIVSAGIWRPVRVRLLPPERLETVYLDTLSASPHTAHLQLFFQAHTERKHGERYELEITGACGDSTFSVRRPMLFPAGNLRFTVENPKLWWPRGRGEANLYQVQVRLLKNGEEQDHLTLNLGIRTVALERTDLTDEEGKGEFCFRVNGERIFALGTNWVPADAFHSRDLERLPRMVEMLADVGCNMVRCWGGNVYENDLFYDLCDQKGILIWQDFSMACAVYPHAEEFQARLQDEAFKVVRRLRQHPCILLWAGDNECDQAYSWGGRRRDPNANLLTRQLLPSILQAEDPSRPYLPSSPYIAPAAYEKGERYLPENHLWGPRDYYKSRYYTTALCHFVSEIGYHGCPAPESLRKFLSPEKLWPYQNNEEWRLHATSPLPGVDLYDYRVELMANQVRELFGQVPDNLEEFAFASQVSQAEAKKFFVEWFRCGKWRRTGILWWNLIDGWPQFSDAVVDYYFTPKLAYHFLKRAQSPLLLALREPENWGQDLVACNDTRHPLTMTYRVEDVETGETLLEGTGIAAADAVTRLGRLPFSAGRQRFYLLRWESELGAGVSHYLAGYPPFSLAQYRHWLEQAGLTP